MFVFVKHKNQEQQSVTAGEVISMQQVGDNSTQAQINNTSQMRSHLTKTKIG